MPEAEGLKARRAAHKTLCKVITKNQGLDQTGFSYPDFSPQEEGFTKSLVLSVLRHYGPLCNILRELSSTGKDIKPAELRILACMGLSQLLLLNVPDHAAVDTTIRLAAKSGFSRQKNFLNALLRNALRSDTKMTQDDMKMHHYPGWITRSWQASYGKEKTSELIVSLMKEAPLDITCPDETHRQELMTHYEGQCEAIGLHTLRFKDKLSAVQDMKDYNKGTWWVQDAASAFPISSLIESPLLDEHFAGKKRSDLKILDICAAPGGKTMQLANIGAHVTAIDISERRMNTLKENIKRTQLTENTAIITQDALKHTGSYDLIILDAPCTATGTMRRHPDIAFVKNKGQMDDLIKIQRNLIQHAISLLNENGLLLYCTCSLQQEEGENIVKQLINDEISCHNIEIKELPPSTEDNSNNNGMFRSLPCAPTLYGDGFFSALISIKK